MSPFEAVYGRPPPTVLDYVPGSATVAGVDEHLAHHKRLLSELKQNILRAQLRMKHQTDQHRSDREFQAQDWVYLKLQPYRQHSLRNQPCSKLSKRFYGPFQILEKIGKVAYRLQLPANAHIHKVFHVSLLKKHKGEPPTAPAPFPDLFEGHHPIITPHKILGFRTILHRKKPSPQFLVQWNHLPLEDASWEPATEFVKAFPSIDLEDKVIFYARGIVTGWKGVESILEQPTVEPKARPTRKAPKPAWLKDFVAT
ncbi:unnamed protein product [Rhodiola kirilowii]